MVVQGLALLFGGRGDAGRVRPGDARAVVEGRLVLPPDHPAVLRALDAGGELDDGVLLVQPRGRPPTAARARTSAAAACRSACSASWSDSLVAVHGQSDQQRLLQPARQRAALDRFAGAAGAGAA